MAFKLCVYHHTLHIYYKFLILQHLDKRRLTTKILRLIFSMMIQERVVKIIKSFHITSYVLFIFSKLVRLGLKLNLIEPGTYYWLASQRELMTLIDVIAFQYYGHGELLPEGGCMDENTRVNILK